MLLDAIDRSVIVRGGNEPSWTSGDHVTHIAGECPPWELERHRPEALQLNRTASPVPDGALLDEDSEEAAEDHTLQKASPARVCEVCGGLFSGAICRCSQLAMAHPIAKILARTRATGPLSYPAIDRGPGERRRRDDADEHDLAV